MSSRVSVNRPLYFSKKQLEECNNRTFGKLKIHLPICKEDVHFHIGTDDWGVHFISYGNMDEMTELVNMILTWKAKAKAYDKWVGH